MTQPLTPTQADRDAAAELHKIAGRWSRASGIRVGECDDDEWVQAFARHAQAAREDALEQAEDAIRHCYDIGRIEAGLCGLLIGAIRSLDPLSIAEKGV